MTTPNIQSLESPPADYQDVTTALIDGSITFQIDLPSQAELAFTLPTPAGESPPFYLVRHNGAPFWYIHFHGVDFMRASANVEVGFTRSWYVLHALGVRAVLSGAAAGSIHPDMKPGDLAVMTDFVDFSTHRPRSMLSAIWEQPPWVGALYNPPLCPAMTALLVEIAHQRYDMGAIFETGTLGQFEGHRFESPGEIRMAQAVGVDMVAHHQASEAIYARELGIHYGALNYISNIAAGLFGQDEKEFVTDEEAKSGYALCADILLETMARLASQQLDCTVCPQPDEQPVTITEIEPKPVYR